MKKIIVCVDDERTVLNSLKGQLKKNFGNAFSYEMCENAEEALELLAELEDAAPSTVFIVVSDWLMPGMKGDEFLHEVSSRYPKIMTTMLTGQANQDAIDRARQNPHLLACLFKPWEEKDLITVLRNAINNLEE